MSSEATRMRKRGLAMSFEVLGEVVTLSTGKIEAESKVDGQT